MTHLQTMKNNNKTKMKKNIMTIIGVAALLATVNLQAQTNAPVNPPPVSDAVTNPIPNFINEVAVWGTSFNTNYNWTNVTLQIEDGYKQATGSGASDYLRVQYDMGRWNAGVEGEFLGVGSQFNAIEAEAGFALVQKYDFKIEANLLAGYDRTLKSFEVEPEVKAVKMLTVNTYATLGLSMPWMAKGKFDGTPQLRVGAGFTF